MSEQQKSDQTSKRTAPRDVRRRQLIMAAMDSIAKRGFSDTTLRHVTEKAKLSHGVVNYHFDSKEALYDATLGYLAEEHHGLWTKNADEAGPNPAHQLAAIIEADFDKKVCTPKKLAVWFAFWGQAKYRPNYLKIHNSFDNKRSDEIERLCEALLADSDAQDQSAAQAARTIEALSDGLWLSFMLYPTTATREECVSDCFHTLAKMFPKHFTGTGAKGRTPCAKTK